MDNYLDNIKVSVITPVHNDERFIAETLNSILNQTHQNIEVIVVDDNSSDSTIKIIEGYDDSRIKLFKNNKNLGAAFSRNLAISKATGDYIAFLDGDDIWKVNKLEIQLKHMIERNYAFSYSNYEIIDDNGNSLKKIVSGPKRISHKKFLKMCYIGCLTAMYRRDVYPDLSIPVSILKRNDYALWLKLSERAPCYLINECLASYRKRTSNSISSGKKTKLIKYHKLLFCELYRFGSFKSTFYALRNALYYFLKRIKYVKKVRRLAQ